MDRENTKIGGDLSNIQRFFNQPESWSLLLGWLGVKFLVRKQNNLICEERWTNILVIVGTNVNQLEEKYKVSITLCQQVGSSSPD